MVETATAPQQTATQSSNEKATTLPSVDKLELPHLELINEENIQVEKLPKEIKQKMAAMQMPIGRYKKNPTEKLKESAIRNSIVIADMIQTYLEESLPEKSSVKDDAEEEKHVTPPPQKTISQLIKEELSNNDGQIHYNTLKKLLAKDSLRSSVIVGDMILDNIWMTNYYEERG